MFLNGSLSWEYNLILVNLHVCDECMHENFQCLKTVTCDGDSS